MCIHMLGIKLSLFTGCRFGGISIVKWANCNQSELIHRPRGYKIFSMLNSTEHEILNAQKYKNIKKCSFS